ncbi:hypothetical protein AAMO2058_001637400 [Amorphochlora amoebiformis]
MSTTRAASSEPQAEEKHPKDPISASPVLGSEGNPSASAERRPMSVVTMPRSNESRKLFTVLCNYLSLSQFELARTVIDQLFQIHPDRVVRALRELILGKVDGDWLTSKSVRSRAHLSWLGYVEYRSLHKRVCASPTPYGAGVAAAEGKKDRLIARWGVLRAKMRPGARINPLGFVSHDVIAVEACEVQLDDRIDRWVGVGQESLVGGGGRWWLRMSLEAEGQTQCTRILQATGKTTRTCSWKEVLPARIRFGDSKLILTVTAHRDNTSTSAIAARVGQCTLPLTQIRTKPFYHIWIPLSPVSLSKGGNAVGRIRVKVRWMHLPRPARPISSQPTPRGDIPWGVKAQLRATLLVFHAQEVGLMQKAVATRLLAVVERLVKASDTLHWDYVRRKIISDSHKKPSRASGVGAGLSGSHHGPGGGEGKEGGVRGSGKGLGLALGGGLEISREAFLDLRKVIRAVPSVGHGICSILADLQHRFLLVKAIHAQELNNTTKAPGSELEEGSGPTGLGSGPLGSGVPSSEMTLLACFYAQLLGEMLLRREFDAACEALRVLVSRIHSAPRRSEILDEVFNAFAVYIHEPDYREVERNLFKLFDNKRITNLSAARGPNPLNAPPVEVTGQSPGQILEFYRNRLDLKCKVYSSILTGADRTHDYHLRRFCYIENKLLTRDRASTRPTAGPGLPSGAASLPRCFHDYAQALYAVNLMDFGSPPAQVAAVVGGASAWKENEKTRAREECLASFWCEYTRYCRVSKNHIFQFPLRAALDRIRDSDWVSAKVLLRPFPQLRALAILLAWDHTGDFGEKRMLMQHLWTNATPIDLSHPQGGASNVRGGEEEKEDSGFLDGGHCGEPRITRCCNRLAFYIRLVDSILQSHSQAKHESQGKKDSRGKNIFEVLWKQSLLSALREYLPDPGIDPSALLKLLHTHRFEWAGVGSECGYDLDLLRAYFAIRGVLQLVVDNDVRRAAGTERGAGSGVSGSVWDVTQAYIASMSRLEVQVLTVEKIFCLVFITTGDLNRSDSKSDPTGNAPDEKKFVCSIPVCRQILKFLNHVISLLEPTRGVHQEKKTRVISSRLRALKSHVQEGLWRLSVLSKLGDQFANLNLMVKPLEAISLRFLRLNRLDDIAVLFQDSRLAEGHQKLVKEAKCWHALCDVLRSHYAAKPTNADKLVKQVEESIEQYANEVRGTEGAVSGRVGEGRVQGQASLQDFKPLQGFLFAVDLAVTFSHMLSVRAYRGILNYASRYLEQTAIARSAYNQEQRLSKFYLAFVRNRLAARPLSSPGQPAPQEISLDEKGEPITRQDGTDVFTLLETILKYTEEESKGTDDPHSRINSGDHLQLSWAKPNAEENTSSDALSGPDALLEWIKQYGSGGSSGQGDGKATGVSPPVAADAVGASTTRGGGGGRSKLEYLQQYRRYFADTAGDGEGDMTPFEDDRIFRFLASIADGIYHETGTPNPNGIGLADGKSWARGEAYEDRPDLDPKPNPEGEEEVDQEELSTEVVRRVGALAQRILLPLLCVRQALPQPKNVKLMASIGDKARKAAQFLPCFHRWVSWRVSVYVHALHLLRPEGLKPLLESKSLAGLAKEDVGSDSKAYIIILTEFLKNHPTPDQAATLLSTRKTSEVVKGVGRTISTKPPISNATDEEKSSATTGPRGPLVRTVPTIDLHDAKLLEGDAKASPNPAVSPSIVVPSPSRVANLPALSPSTPNPTDSPVRAELSYETAGKEGAGAVGVTAGGGGGRDQRATPSGNLAVLGQALRLADRHLNPTDPQGRALVQELLERIIPLIPHPDTGSEEDKKSMDSKSDRSGSGGQEEYRARCILRLEDPERAGILALRYLPYWRDARMCAQVLFKLLAGLEGGGVSSEIKRPPNKLERGQKEREREGEKGGGGRGVSMKSKLIARVRRKYRVCLYYQQLARAVPEKERSPELKDGLTSWQTLERMCETDLRRLVDVVIRCRQVVLADKLFHLFIKTPSGAPARALLGETVTWLQTKLTNARSAADLARLLRKGSPTRDRIRAMKQLRLLGEGRVYVVAKDLLVQLESSHSLHVVVRYLENYFQTLTSKSQKDNSKISSTEGKYPHPMSDPKEAAWFEGVKVGTRMLLAVPKNLQRNLLKFYTSPSAILKALLEGEKINEISRLLELPIFASYRRFSRTSSHSEDPLQFMLNFGKDVLTLKSKHGSLGKDVGFKCLEWCLRATDLRPKVRVVVLDACNELSRRLASQLHKLLTVHLIQSLLKFFKSRCLAGRDISQTVKIRFDKYWRLAFTPRSSVSIGEGKSKGESGAVDAGMLLYRICRVKFCLDDLLNPLMAEELRKRLMKEDEMALAEEVWVQCEGKPRSKFAQKRNNFIKMMQSECKKYHEAYEKRQGGG